MNIDSCIVLACNAAILFFLAHHNPQFKGLRWFARSLASAAGGVGLILLHGRVPDWLSVLTGAALFPICIVCARRGLASLNGRISRLLPLDVALVLIQTTLLAYYTYWPRGVDPRYAIASLAVLIEIGMVFAELWMAPETGFLPRRAMLRWVAGFGVFCALRVLVSALGMERAWGLKIADDLTTLGQVVFSTVMAFGSFWLSFTEMHRQLEGQVRQDALTQLPNRRALQDALAREIGRSRREGKPLAAISLDLDHFKRVNDRFGHLAGDAALRAVAGELRAAVRSQDWVARLGGEEFAILLAGQEAADAWAGAERLRLAVAAAAIEFDGQRIALTASLGLARLDEDSELDDDAGDSLLRRADLAMYAAKRDGRNRTVAAEAAKHAPDLALHMSAPDPERIGQE